MTANDFGTLLAGDRQAYRLEQKIGEGGEGAVYAVEDRSDLVAKIYRDFDFQKREKLEHMSGLATKRLLRVSAWPLSPLTDAENRVVGFVMPFLNGWQPLYTVYNVRQRLQAHPDRTWQFVLRAARNLAVCIHEVHEEGFVVGDLNESNVLVDHRAMVKLIDVDSFQVRVGNRLHGCFVGRSELLAPELQGRSLEDLERSPQHDRFALAVLIFQLLAFGRHPFAGRQEDDVERTLEHSIRSGYYAYSKRRPGPLKPPAYFALDFLPGEILDLFERAFDPTESNRPSGTEWFSALRVLEKNLLTCPENSNHRYWSGCERCPWCKLEDQGGIALFPAKISPEELLVDADDLWSSIDPLIKKFEAMPEPNWLTYQTLEPMPLSRGQRLIARFGSMSMLPMYFYFVFFQSFSFRRGFGSPMGWWILIPFLLLCITCGVGVAQHLRKRRVDKAQAKQKEIEFEYWGSASRNYFELQIEKLVAKRNLLVNFEEATEQARRTQLRAKNTHYLEKFLSKYSTLAADIGSFGRDQLANLYDRGIKTAADVKEEVLVRQPVGYSKVLKSLLAWRSALEKQFWDTGSFQLSAIEEQKLRKRMHKEAQEAKRELREAPEMLEDLITEIHYKRLELNARAEPFQHTIHELGPRVLAFELLTKPKAEVAQEKVPAS